MYVGMTRARTRLQLFCARNRTLFGQTKSNPPSRFLDALPDAVTERRSDDVLSAFAWASASGQQKAWTRDGPEAHRQRTADFDVEFNQDLPFEEDSQKHFDIGSRVRHPSFGIGTIIGRRGDVAEVQFDSGQRKHLALSIAPLTML
jgi:DNA helicase-2/ATP-dependent DNA helicase PcrA